MPFAPYTLKFRKSTQSKHNPKTNLKRYIILHRAPQVHTLHIALYLSIGYEMYAVALRSLHASDQKANEEREGLRKDRET